MNDKKLRLVVTVDPEIPVPPPLYGGIERIVDMIVTELQRRGHEVHLFANRQSTVKSKLAPYPADSSTSVSNTLQNMRYLSSYVRHNGPFDIIHSFARLAYLLPLLPNSIPKIQSYQRFISKRSVRLGTAIGRNSLTFTSCSRANATHLLNEGFKFPVIYNGVNTSTYDFVPAVPDDAPLVFLGRVERIKGAHKAIEIAKKTGKRLIIAGNHAVTGAEADYFAQDILPQCDGKQISYIGAVNDTKKNELLGQAAALLFPIEWEEPFGIVMVEALACGTPVIGSLRGSVPEVIDEGLTGFICKSTEEMIASVGRLHQIKRSNCRAAFERRFSEQIITDQYERLYYSRISERNTQ